MGQVLKVELKRGNKHEKLLEQSVSVNPNLCIHQILLGISQNIYHGTSHSLP